MQSMLRAINSVLSFHNHQFRCHFNYTRFRLRKLGSELRIQIKIGKKGPGVFFSVAICVVIAAIWNAKLAAKMCRNCAINVHFYCSCRYVRILSLSGFWPKNGEELDGTWAESAPLKCTSFWRSILTQEATLSLLTREKVFLDFSVGAESQSDIFQMHILPSTDMSDHFVLIDYRSNLCKSIFNGAI